MSKFTLGLYKDERTGEPVIKTMGDKDRIEEAGVAMRIPAEPIFEQTKDRG